jgi:hypothetical protein
MTGRPHAFKRARETQGRDLLRDRDILPRAKSRSRLVSNLQNEVSFCETQQLQDERLRWT